jgi:hypothetical protein
MTTQFMRNYIDLINEADAGTADIGQIAASLKFLPTTKLARKYQFVANGVPGRMPAMTYTVAAQEQPVVTVTSDGKETQNVAAVNDIIMSGPSQENYVVKAAKFPKLYQGAVGKTVIPEQSPRMVALYRGPQAVTFTAPWGESMVLKPGDYLVKDGDAGYYRIARVEYDQTYNAPGKQGMTEQELDELTRRDFLRGAGAALGGAALASLADKVGARVPLKGGEVDPDYRPRPIQVKVDKFESDGAGGGVMTIGAKRYPFKQLRLSDPVPEGQRILLLPTDFGSKGMFPVIAVYSGGVIYCCDRSANESSQHKEMDETASPDALARIEELIHYKS